MTGAERRKSVRVPARLAMEIVVGGDLARVETINVSASGVYFTSTKFIEPLTRLQVTLDLAAEDRKRHSVVCDGVVVRVEPENFDPDVESYEVACYFTNVSSRDQLESYIRSHVPF